MMSFSLAGKYALVTGASSGLGRHFADVLADHGAHVILAARRTAAIEAAVAEIEARGGAARAVAMDVTDHASVKAAVEAAGPVDILVNNAGVTVAKPVLDLTEEDYDWVMDTNQKGVFLVATAVARLMRKSGTGGSIINIASILGLRQGGQLSAYAASKAAVIQLTRQLALELARYDIRCNAIAPGYFVTELNDDFFASEAGKKMIQRIPQRRLGQLADLDGPLLLLASDASRFMTGSTITVDGGHLLSGL